MTVEGSDDKYYSLFKSAGEGIMILSVKGEVLDINPEFLRITGYKREDFIGKNIIHIARLFKLSVRNVLSRFKGFILGKEKESEWVITNKKGDKVVVHVHPSFVKKNGRLLFISVIMRDITEEKRAKERIMESEEKHRLLLENTGQGIIQIDRLGNIVSANPRILEITGMSEEEFIGKNIVKLAPIFKVNLKSVLIAFKDMLRGKPINEFEWRLKTVKGEIIIRANPAPIKRDGKIIGYVVILEDITEKKRIEEFEKEREVNDLKNQFLMRASHELRHPLVPILGYSNLLLDEASDSQKIYLEKIASNANQLKDLINKFLSVASLQAGEKLSLVKMNLKEFINELVSDYEKQFGFKGVKVLTDFKSSPKAMVNEEKARDALFELLNNALKYGSNKVKIKLEEEKHDAVISVEDNGKGIKKDVINQLLKRRYVTKLEPEKMYKGIGIGLLLVKLVVNAHNGVLDIKSGRQGTKVIIKIPRK
jgi:PAS domain S-box-containing protein